MFYLLCVSKWILKIFGNLFDIKERFLGKILSFIKNRVKNVKLKKKNTKTQQEI